jgi:hypothetical protein
MGKGENLPWKERKPLDEKRSFIAEWERQEDTSARIMIRCIDSTNGKPIFGYSR